MRARLRDALLVRYGTQTCAAHGLGISTSRLSAILNGAAATKAERQKLSARFGHEFMQKLLDGTE